MNLTILKPKVEYKMTAKYKFCLVLNSVSSAFGFAVSGSPLIFSIAMAKAALLSIQTETSLVRNVLF
jgi:hypothetical protein